MSEQKNKNTERKHTARTFERRDFKVAQSIASEVVCGALALITTVLIWLSGAF